MLGSSSHASTDREPVEQGEQIAFVDPSTGERYTLIQPLGRGGMGEAYEARLDYAGRERTCVVKFCRRDRIDDPKSQARFVREAAFGWEVTHNHPNLVTTYRSGIWNSGDTMFHGQPFLVLEFVDGPHLRAASREIRECPTLIRRVTRDVLSALAYLHQQKVLHCDVSLRNILIGSDGIVKLADLGLAQHDASHDFDGSHGVMVYASPEVLLEGWHTFASDIYSLGAAIYDLITGDGPYGSGEAIQVAMKMKRSPEVVIPEHVPDDIATLLSAFLRQEPSERPSAIEALTTLEASGEPIASVDEIAAVARRWRAELRQAMADGRRNGLPRDSSGRDSKVDSRAPTPRGANLVAGLNVVDANPGASKSPEPTPRRTTESLAHPPPPGELDLFILKALQAEDAMPQLPSSKRWAWAVAAVAFCGCLVLGWRAFDHTDLPPATTSDGRESETTAETLVLMPADRTEPDDDNRDTGENDDHHGSNDDDRGDDNDRGEIDTANTNETRTSRQTLLSRQAKLLSAPQGYMRLEATSVNSGEHANHANTTPQDDHDIDE